MLIVDDLRQGRNLLLRPRQHDAVVDHAELVCAHAHAGFAEAEEAADVGVQFLDPAVPSRTTSATSPTFLSSLDHTTLLRSALACSSVRTGDADVVSPGFGSTISAGAGAGFAAGVSGAAGVVAGGAGCVAAGGVAGAGVSCAIADVDIINAAASGKKAVLLII